MATYTLTPSRIWQVEKGIITGVDLDKYQFRDWGGKYQKIILEIDINSDMPFYYALMTQGRIDVKYCYTYTDNPEAIVRNYFQIFTKLLNNVNDLYVGKEIDVADYTWISQSIFSCLTPNQNSSATRFSTLDEKYYNNISNLNTNKIYLLVDYVKEEGSYHNSTNVYRVRNDLTFLIDYVPLSEVGSIVINPWDSFLNVNSNNIFEVSVNPELKSFHKIDINGGYYYYKKETETSYRSSSFTGNSFIINSGTLAIDNIYNIYATCDLGNGTTTSSEIGNYTTTDIKGSVVNGSPINSIMTGNVNFTWNYSSVTGTPQYAYDLDVSYDDGVNWINLSNHVISSETSSIQNINHSGNVYWRVRCYNQSDIASDYSTPTMFLNVLPPRAPVITNVIYASTPSIYWNSEDQASFQLLVLDGNDNIIYDSGYIYSTVNSYQLNTYLQNGLYKFKLRTSNNYGMFSDYTDYSYLQNITINVPPVSYSITDDGILLETDSSGFDYVLIKRNDELIGRFNNNLYIDKYYKNGINRYSFIFVTSNNEAGFYFLDIPIEISIKEAVLIDQEGNIFKINKRWNNRIIPQREVRADSESINYLGAYTPEINTTNLIIRSFNVSCYDENNRLESLIGKTLFYRSNGLSAWVVLTALSRSDSWYGNEVALNLQETIFNEAITDEI